MSDAGGHTSTPLEVLLGMQEDAGESAGASIQTERLMRAQGAPSGAGAVQENEPLMQLEREASPEVVIEREPALEEGEPGAPVGESSRGHGGVAHDGAGRSQDDA